MSGYSHGEAILWRDEKIAELSREVEKLHDKIVSALQDIHDLEVDCNKRDAIIFRLGEIESMIRFAGFHRSCSCHLCSERERVLSRYSRKPSPPPPPPPKSRRNSA